MKKIIRLLLDLLFPLSKIAKELDSLSMEEIFTKCQKKNSTNKNIWSIFAYKDLLIKEMLWQIKFNGQRKYAEYCGKFLYDKIFEIIDKKLRYIIIPVPIHKKRRKERGFNQCEWICEEIMKIDQGKFLQYEPGAVNRIIYKQKQSWSNRKERIENMKGVFSIVKVELLKNKNVIIVDDVLTTGATLTELVNIIIGSGAKKVLSFTVAH